MYAGCVPRLTVCTCMYTSILDYGSNQYLGKLNLRQQEFVTVNDTYQQYKSVCVLSPRPEYSAVLPGSRKRNRQIRARYCAGN